MHMTDSEILSSYNHAEDKKKQVQILADLNACDKKSIKEVLISQGIPAEELDGRRKQGGDKAVAKPQKSTPKEPQSRAEIVKKEEPQKKPFEKPEIKETSPEVPEVVLDVVKAYRDSLLEELEEINNFLKLHGIE